jgi:hypothetical protein
MFSQTKFRQSPQISSSSEQIHSTANYASSQENSNITAMTSKTTVYTVKEYKGHIGVFMNDETVPYKEVMVEVASLPETDQQLLSKGIMANNQSKLNHILEDYRS